MKQIQCGTNSGYQKHRRNGEEACPACRKAKADYEHRYRVTHPADARTNALRVNARQRAARRVAADYPEVFEAYLAEELAVPHE